MRLILALIGLSILALTAPGVAQVSTDDSAEPSLPIAEPIEDSAMLDDDANMRSDADSKNDDTDEFITPSRRASEEGPEAALGSRSAHSRSAVRGSRSASSGPRGGRPENRWRYQYYNGYWWYWTPNNRWAFFSGRRWIDYDSELANQWARGGAVGRGAMGLGGGGYYGLGGAYGAGGGVNRGLGSAGPLGSNAGALRGGVPGIGTAPGRSALPSFRGGASQAAGGLNPIGAGGSLGGGAGGAVTGEGLGSSLLNSSGGMAAVPGISGTRGSLGGASGVGINAGVPVGGRSGDANTGVGGGAIGGAGIGGTGGGMGGVGSGR